MVEEDFSFVCNSLTTMPSTTDVPAMVTTTSVTHCNEHTLGAALDAFEQRVSNAGTVLDISVPRGCKEKDGGNKISGKVLRCPNLVDLAIKQAIAYGKATEDKVTVILDDESNVVPGNVVALYDRNKHCFLTPFGEKKDSACRYHLPRTSESEFFLVVSGRIECSIALYSPIHHCFLLHDEQLSLLHSPKSQAIHDDDRPRSNETFTFCKGPQNMNKRVMLKIGGATTSYEIMQVKGFDF
jgi:hypothetical protein